MTSTLPDDPPLPRIRRAQLGRRAGICLLVVFVLAGAVGVFGVHARTVTSNGGGYRLQVTYAQVARPGHGVPLLIRISHEGGFGAAVDLRVRASYFALFSDATLDPQPTSETRDGDYDYYSFSPPAGSELVISSHTQVAAQRQHGASGDVAVLAHGKPVATVHFRTRIFP